MSANPTQAKPFRHGSVEQSRRQKPVPDKLAHTALRFGSVAHGLDALHEAVHMPPGTFTAHVPFWYGHDESPQHWSPIQRSLNAPA